MAHCNENFNDLQGAYLFAKIRKEQETYKANYPDADIISLGIGDVTQPLVPAVVEAMMKAVAEMGEVETFRGYGPEQGYLSREVFFGNQWARSKEGKWSRLTDATFTHDATASAQVRLDYQGGNTKDNPSYLKMGASFNESVPMGTKFYCKPTGKEPEIDWEALKQL